MKVYRSEKVFNTINTLVLTLFTLLVIFPFWYVLACSLTDQNYFAEKGGLIFFPTRISFNFYSYLILENDVMLKAYLNTILYTVTGTAVALVLSILTAYALAEKGLPGRRIITLFFVFTMYFNGGLVPTYVTMKNYNLVDTRLGFILSLCFLVFNVILMRTFFEGIPMSLKESAKIDGASDLRVMLQIVMPLSVPAIATVGLFYAVGFWNDFLHSMLYASGTKITTVQNILLNIINSAGVPTEMVVSTGRQIPSQTGIRMAAIIIVGLPMMILYPFIQKYFEKGLTLGGEKG